MRKIHQQRPVRFMAQATMTIDERNEILAKIKLGREMMREITAYTDSLPEWAGTEPFREQTKRYEEVLDLIAGVTSDTVRVIDTKLSTNGPWMKLSDNEIGSLSSWFNGIEELYSIYKSVSPDEYTGVRVAGAATAVGILFAAALVI